MKKEKINKIKNLTEEWGELEKIVSLLKMEEVEFYMVVRPKEEFRIPSIRIPLKNNEIIKEILREKEIKLESIGKEIETLIKNQ